MMRRGALFTALGATAAAVAVACFAPTEVRLKLTTDVPCPTSPPAEPLNTGIYVGASLASVDSVTESSRCTPDPAGNDLGDLVIVPSGARDARVTVEVALGTEGASSVSCHPLRPTDPIDKRCIVARRSFAFIEHTSRTLPIRLTANCLGRTCADANDTCIDGECRSANVDQPAEDGGRPTVGEDASLDGAAPDAVAPDPPCLVKRDGGFDDFLTGNELGTDVLAASSTRLYWPSATPGGVSTVTKRGGAVTTIASGLKEPISALAADDALLYIGGKGALYTWDHVNSVLMGPFGTAGQVSRIVLSGGSVYFTVGGGVGSIYQFKNNFVATLAAVTSGDDLAVTNAVAYTLARSGSAIYRLKGGPGGAEQPPIATVAPVNFIAAMEGQAFFSTLGSASAAPGDLGKFGIYRLLDSSGVPELVVEADWASSVAVALPLPNAPSDAPLPGIYYVAGAPGASAVYRVGLPPLVGAVVTAPPPVTSTFSSVQGLVVDPACLYFFASSAGNKPRLHTAARPLK